MNYYQKGREILLKGKQVINNFIQARRGWLFFIAAVIVILFWIFRPVPKTPSIIFKDSTETLAEVNKLKDQNDKFLTEIVRHELLEEQSKRERDSLAKALKIKPKFIKGVDKVIYRSDTVFKTTVNTVILGKDTLYKTEKHDPYVDIVALAGKDRGEIQFSIRDTLTRIEIVKNPLIGRTKRTTVIRNANPYLQSTLGYSWETKEKQTWLSIGPSIQYNPFTQKVDFGISVQIPIIKLKK